MKQPEPVIARDAPQDTVWFGGPVKWFSITLRIVGDDLVPNEITKLLGCSPDRTRQNTPVFRNDGTVLKVTRKGAWSIAIKSDDTDEWDCGQAMMELLQRVPASADMWKALSERYDINFFVGLSMASKNKGFSLSPTLMGHLAERGIEAGFDIYYEPSNET